MKIESNEIFIGEDEQRNERIDDFFYNNRIANGLYNKKSSQAIWSL